MNSAFSLGPGIIRFGDPFENYVAINDGWIKVEASDGVTWSSPVDDSTEDDFGEPIVWTHRSRDGLNVALNFVDEQLDLFNEDRVLNMSKQDAVRTNPNRITMSMDDMLDMLTESEEQNNGTV